MSNPQGGSKESYIPYSYIRSALRRLWMKSPERRAAIQATYVRKEGSKKLHRCPQCEELFPKKDMVCDHKEPVGPTPGSRNAPPGYSWDTFISRLWCSPSNYQAMCKGCHARKTSEERTSKAKERKKK